MLQQRDEHGVVVDDCDVDASRHRAGWLHTRDSNWSPSRFSRLLHRLPRFTEELGDVVAVDLVLRDAGTTGDVDATTLFGEEIQLGDFGVGLLAVGHAGPVSAGTAVKQRNGAERRRVWG